MSNIKIGFDVSGLTTNRHDGTTRYTRELAARLPAASQEHEWFFFAPGDFDLGIPLPANSRKSISPWPKYWTQARLPVDLLRYKPDVLFMPIQQLPSLRPRRMKTVAVIHDLAFHQYGQQYTFKDWLLLHAFSAQVARQADQIIAVSQATAKDIAAYYGRTEHVHVIHHGVDLQTFRVFSEEEKTASWQKLAVAYPKLRKPYLLYVGQMQPRKNLVRLVEAFADVHAEHRDLQLVISSGHGWKQREIMQAIEHSRVREHIYLPGAISDDLLATAYNHAQAFALVSTYEGFGMPILEALACGVPVVTSNVSSMPEVAAGRAELVDPLNVESIAEGIKKALRQGGGQGLGPEYSWDICAQKTVQIILR